MEVGFSYGIFADSLEEQANAQGFTLGKEVERLEKIRHAINMCGFHVATDSQVTSMLKKLHKNVTNSIEPLKQAE